MFVYMDEQYVKQFYVKRQLRSWDKTELINGSGICPKTDNKHMVGMYTVRQKNCTLVRFAIT